MYQIAVLVSEWLYNALNMITISLISFCWFSFSFPITPLSDFNQTSLSCSIVSVPFDEDDKDKSVWFLDHDYLENMAGMFKKVNGVYLMHDA